MQRVINRTTLARNQAARKAQLQKKKERRLDFMDSLRERTSLERTKLDNLRAERINRREDWFKGPLAPNRDSGLTAGAYGTLTPQDTVLPPVPKHLRRRFINFAAGDYVVLLKGPDKGKICEVTAVNIERESVTLGDTNQVDIRYPDWAQQEEDGKNLFVTNNMPVPIDDVRLVVTLEENGQQYQAIAKHVYGGGPFLHRPNPETPRHCRYISGDDIPIPWPSENTPFRGQDEDGDTSRKEVEHETYKPKLLEAPFDSRIIDELRNKFSKYRTRHDPQWVENRKLEDLREEYMASRTLLTPRGELRVLRAKQKEAIRQSKLDDAGNYIMDTKTSEFIAQFMAKKSLEQSTVDSGHAGQ